MKELATVRERTEELEKASLSTWATLATETKGRDRHEEPDGLRTAFAVDRDRIAATQSFRRLAQTAFTSPSASGSSALMHTLHVASLARTIARALRLNEDLVEAIAFGHDLGMPPFGRTGEEALSTFTTTPFRHGEQSLRVVEKLAGAGGLNLTWEVRDGIACHDDPSRTPSTLEGQVVRQADRIAAALHDGNDAIVAGIVAPAGVPDEVMATLGSSLGEWTARAALDVVTESVDRAEISVGRRVDSALRTLSEFLDARVHQRPSEAAERDRALHCLRSITVFYLEAPTLLPAHGRGEPSVTRVCDFVCGLDDPAALEEFRRRFLPARP